MSWDAVSFQETVTELLKKQESDWSCTVTVCNHSKILLQRPTLTSMERIEVTASFESCWWWGLARWSLTIEYSEPRLVSNCFKKSACTGESNQTCLAVSSLWLWSIMMKHNCKPERDTSHLTAKHLPMWWSWSSSLDVFLWVLEIHESSAAI